MIDAGVLPGSKPSTVVKVNQDDSVEILREGVIVKEEIDKIINSR
jgi:tRNA A37 threonylcarbamoyladenosine synthetase subunit TsaC/SUA5/YrdC